jgi:hypothetical protein
VTLQHFTYISSTRLTGLEAQVRSRFSAFGLSAKASIPGIAEVGAELSGKPADTTVARTLALTAKLRKRSMVLPLAGAGELGTAKLYHDVSPWAHGLFAFSGDTSLNAGVRVFSYLAWRRWNDSLLLLAGSPTNVLGENVVREGVWAYGTTGTWDLILQFTEAFNTDEFTIAQTVQTSASEAPGAPLSLDLMDLPRGLGLAMFCLRHLSRLATNQLDTMFRITRRIDLGPPRTLPQQMIADLGHTAVAAQQANFLRNCRNVYIGSPLYTAIA